MNTNSALTDFVNHGMLPFVGRNTEVESVVTFWRETINSTVLRSLLLTGEAGSGKSRLIDEVKAIVESEGGTVIHARLRPESAVSLLPIIAEDIWRSDSVTGLIRNPPEPSVSSVADSLRRLSHLRLTLLIIEDIHLLTREALRDFSLLVQALQDTPIALLCAARPVELPARSVLEGSLTVEMFIKGFGEETIAELWKQLLGGNADAMAVGQLQSSTLGNPLALRSALRGAFQQNAIVRTGADGFKADPRFAAIVRRSANSLSEGMAAHLTSDELQASERLATLGEIFSVEAATRMLEGTNCDLRSLVFKGILVEPNTASSPLPGMQHSVELPLAFTHSLFHRKLVDATTPDIHALIEIIANDYPLYTLVPIHFIAETDRALDDLHADTIRNAINHLLTIATELDKTADWILAESVWNAAQRLLELSHFEELERRRTEAVVLAASIRLYRRETLSEEYRARVDRLLEMTSGADDPVLMELHISANKHLCSALLRSDYERFQEVVRETDAFIAEHPSLKATDAFGDYFIACIYNARSVGNMKHLHELETRLEEYIQDTSVPQERRNHIALHGRFSLLTHFTNRDDLERRLRDIEYLESLRSSEFSQQEFHRSKSFLYAHIGKVREAIEEAGKTEKAYKDNGQMMQYFTMKLRRAQCLFGITPDVEALQNELVELIESAPESLRTGFYPIVRSVINFAGSLRDDIRWTHPVILQLIADTSSVVHPALELLRHYKGEYELTEEFHELLEQADPDDYISNGVAALVLHPTQERAEDMVVRLDRYFAEFDLCRLTQISDLRLLVLLLPHIEKAWMDVQRYQAAISNTLRTALNWLGELKLPGYIAPILRQFTEYLNPDEITEWNERLDVMISEEGNAKEDRGTTEKSVRLMFFGKTRFAIDGESTAREPRGNRLRTLLGVMAVQELLSVPLERNEFLSIASDNPGDPKAARSVVNMTVSRLRDVMGTEAILTDADTPRLNPEIVSVDAIEAFAMITDARAALRSGAILKARQCVTDALRLWNGDVLFATLYDELFEKLREDFESGVVAVATATVQSLMHAEDYEHAALILEQLHAIMPDDEEISGLYRTSLERTGRKTAAERARMKTEAKV